jgi:ABC-2 type transport system permease protein
MSKVWQIAEQQFRQEVLKRGFLLALLSLPLFLGLMIGMGALGNALNRHEVVIGYVDPAGALVRTPLPAESSRASLRRFDTPAAAQAALEGGQVSAYYLLPDDPELTGRSELVYFQRPDDAALHSVEDTVRRNLMAGQPPEVVDRLIAGPLLTVRAAALGREFGARGPRASDVMPLVVAVLTVFLVLTVSGTLMEALVVEKENRTVEIVMTSVSPGRLMAGKILGIAGMALILLVAWVLFFVAAAWLGGVLGIAWLQDVRPNWRDLGLLAVVALPSLLFISALMAMIGATLAHAEEAGQIGALTFMVLLLPIYLFFMFARDPHGPLSIAFSLVPVTAVAALATRSMFAQVPASQYVIAALVSLLCAVVTIWLTGRAFRASMLRYGQRLRLGRLLGRGRRQP